MKQQCIAKAKATGRRFRRAAVAGAVVCRVHGGAAPQVRAAAGERIRALVHPALDAMARAIASNDLTVALRAAAQLLDRAATARGRIGRRRSSAAGRSRKSCCISR